jgi:hypothetical protein
MTQTFEETFPELPKKLANKVKLSLDRCALIVYSSNVNMNSFS